MGEVFAGRYELVDVLGSGGVGTVWRAWDHRDKTYHAAKVLRQADGESLLRFVRETSRRIHHPHVVTPLGWAGEDERVLFTMPLIRGGSLATLLQDFGALPLGWVVELLRQCLTALEAVHEVGLVHRDVKPGNLLLAVTGTDQPYLYLSDFGTAAHVEAPRLTRSEFVIGTPGYFAPEQIRGADPDPLQDIYAAAVVALQNVTGLPPSPTGVLPVFRPTSGAQEALATLLGEMTAPDPNLRTPSVRAALDQLDAIAAHYDLCDEPDPEGPVEVFDQVPPLPQGWTDTGPLPRSPVSQPVSQPVGQPESPREGPPEGPLARPPRSVRADRGPIPLAAWVLAAVGIVLLVVAALMAR